MSLVRALKKPRGIVLAVLLFIWGLAVTFIGHRHAFDAESLRIYMEHGDMISIIHGYQLTPNLWIDGLNWWHGNWINGGGYYYFRPLPSYVHWYQVHLGLHYGWMWATIITLVIHALVAMWSGLATKHFSGSTLAAAIATFLMAAVHYEPPGKPDLLTWFPVIDNLVAMLFVPPAVILFARWNATGERRCYFGSLACAALALLSKEFAYVYPLLALAIVLYGNDPAASKAKLKAVVPCIGLVVAFILWRCIFVPDTPNGLGELLGAVMKSQAPHIAVFHREGLLRALATMGSDWGVVIGLLLALYFIGVFIYIAWSYRRDSPVALTCALFLLSFTPLLKLAADGHRAVFVVFWLPVIAAVCARDLLHERSRRSSLQLTP